MRYLVIPDIHNCVDKARYILSKYEKTVDKIIFLGDFFDSCDDTTQQAKETALFVEEMLDRTDTIILAGNHDISYYFSYNSFCSCSGFSEEKKKQILSNLDIHKVIQKVRLSYYDKDLNTLFTHGGVSKYTYPNIDELGVDYIIEQSKIGWEKLQLGLYHSSYAIGKDTHGGFFGGLCWERWYCLSPLSFNMVVGHTPHSYPCFKYKESTNTYCLDLDTKPQQLNYVGIFDTNFTDKFYEVIPV